MLDKNLWHGELWHGHHDACALALHVMSESSRPIDSVEESYDDVATNCLVDTLQPRSSSQELMQTQALVLVDDLIVGQDHQQGRKLDSSVVVA